MATLLGEDISGLNERAAAEQAITAVEQLRTDIGIPSRLSELDATEEHLEEFADKSFQIKRLLRINPRQASRDDLLEILREAL